MAEPGVDPNTENSKQKIIARLTEAERVLKAIITALKAAEGQGGAEVMPQGEYYGIKFEDF